MAARPAGKPRPRLPLNLQSLLGPSAGARPARGPCVRAQHEGSRGAGEEGRGRARAGAPQPRRRWQGDLPGTRAGAQGRKGLEGGARG